MIICPVPAIANFSVDGVCLLAPLALGMAVWFALANRPRMQGMFVLTEQMISEAFQVSNSPFKLSQRVASAWFAEWEDMWNPT